MIKNKLNSSFGPVGTTTGLILFIVGIAVCFTNWFGLISVILGAFIGFSNSSIYIDADNNRVRFSNLIFGIFPTGEWIKIKSEMKIGIKKSDSMWRAYSRGNRTLDIPDNDYLIMLYDSEHKDIIPLKKIKTFEIAKSELQNLKDILKIDAF